MIGMQGWINTCKSINAGGLVLFLFAKIKYLDKSNSKRARDLAQNSRLQSSLCQSASGRNSNHQSHPQPRAERESRCLYTCPLAHLSHSYLISTQTQTLVLPTAGWVFPHGCMSSTQPLPDTPTGQPDLGNESLGISSNSRLCQLTTKINIICGNYVNGLKGR